MKKIKRGKLQPIIYKSKSNKKYYATLWGSNGKQVWRTGDGYERIAGAMKAVELLNSPKIQYPIIYQ